MKVRAACLRTLPSPTVLGARKHSVQSVKVEAKLNNFLVYGKGDHFTNHVDGRRNPQHFGTLVIQLPSAYTGGLYVVHDSTAGGTPLQTAYRMEVASGEQPVYVAQFRDAVHSVEQVTSGYRAVLVYSLCAQMDTPSSRRGRSSTGGQKGRASKVTRASHANPREDVITIDHD